MNALVEINKLSKTYERDEFKITPLSDINLEINEGEFLALMGPSGSGKTTLLNIIGGLDKPTTGEVLIGGVDINKMSEKEMVDWRKHNISFIFQLYNLLPVLNAFENVELPLLLFNLTKKERKEHAITALKAVGLEDRMDHLPGQLSGGQQQRVAIARAIVTDPKIILADEPTGDLDARSANEILDLMVRLKEEFNKTFIMVSHDPKAAERADRVIHLEKGNIIDGVYS